MLRCTEHRLGVRFFGKIGIRIFDPRSLGSWCIKGTDESTLGKDSSVLLIHHDPSHLGSKIRIRIFPKKRTLGYRVPSTIDACWWVKGAFFFWRGGGGILCIMRKEYTEKSCCVCCSVKKNIQRAKVKDLSSY